MPTFRNTLSHLHRRVGTYLDDGTKCSETSAYKIQTPGNYPEENIQHSQHGESLKSRNTNDLVVCKLQIEYVCFKSFRDGKKSFLNLTEGCNGGEGGLASGASTPGNRIKGVANWAAKLIFQIKRFLFCSHQSLNY